MRVIKAESTRVFLCLAAAILCFAGCKKQEQAPGATANKEDQYLQLMNAGKNYLDQAQAEKALEVYNRAVQIISTDADVHLNLANAHLLAGNADAALKAADEALKLDQNSAAAHFVKGSAWLRLGRYEEALKSLQDARQIEVNEPALAFQIGIAHLNLKQWEAAVAAFEEAVALNPQHPSAHYNAAQALLRLGRQPEAQAHLEAHQAISGQGGGAPITPALLEKSKFTQPRVPFRLEQPDPQGNKVMFVDATTQAFGTNATSYHGPFALLDPAHTGWNSLFVLQPDQGFKLLWNTNAVFGSEDEPYPVIPGAKYSKMLVGDLQNDRAEDVVVLSDKGAHIFKFSTNGFAMDVGPFSRLQGLTAADGALADLDFTGTLDLIAVTESTNDLRLFRQFGPLLFTDVTATSGIPRITNAFSVRVDDMTRDEMMDLVLSRSGAPAQLLYKPRGTPLVPTNTPAWPVGTAFATGDFNNDLRTDLALAADNKIILAQTGAETREIPTTAGKITIVKAFDHDNDGWLDLWVAGDRLQVFRNAGIKGFTDVTAALAVDKLESAVGYLEFADFDLDGDSDAVLAMKSGGLRYLRNDGGNANQQVKVRLLGNRSNASGLGCKIEISAGGLRLSRTVQQLPVEIGVGKHTKLESLVVHWFNLALPSFDVPVDATNALIALEIKMMDGSCPYLYAWNGKEFRFVTDLLGSAPLGLPVAEGRIIESDPTEFAYLGGEEAVAPKDGFYHLQITEELREALYLDEAKLVVADLPPGFALVPNDKLLPGKPFPASELVLFHNERQPASASNLAGQDVTALLRTVDGQRVSPPALRIPQLRGLAEPHGVILEFGELETSRPWALVMNGWLQFGGGMANINGSRDPSLPFPFPTLEAGFSDNTWQKVDVQVGAPAGKTKTLFADLRGKLPAGTIRLKLQAAFEIHWDKISLMEFAAEKQGQITSLSPAMAHLHYRGFSELAALPYGWPSTPEYSRVQPKPYWRITPSGWCTRYGEVLELVNRQDEAMLVMNGGDELSLQFPAAQVPPKPTGMNRHFYIYTDGWDKDSDFHVVTGTTIEPLPWHGLDDQTYGKVRRPEFPSDSLHEKYNTRWVGPMILREAAAR